MHVNNLQRSVNDMEELVDIHDQPIGIADAEDAKPIAIEGGRIQFEDVTFHYGGHRAPLYDGLSIDIRAGERVGLVGRSGSGKTTFVKLVQRLGCEPKLCAQAARCCEPWRALSLAAARFCLSLSQ
jgi:ATP-binding cassette subfamily B protein